MKDGMHEVRIPMPTSCHFMSNSSDSGLPLQMVQEGFTDSSNIMTTSGPEQVSILEVSVKTHVSLQHSCQRGCSVFQQQRP